MRTIRVALPVAAKQFLEIRVYDAIAECTGTVVDRETIRGSAMMCRSMMELTRLSRRLGDGTFYLPVALWPAGKKQIPLAETWTTMS